MRLEVRRSSLSAGRCGTTPGIWLKRLFSRRSSAQDGHEAGGVMQGKQGDGERGSGGGRDQKRHVEPGMPRLGCLRRTRRAQTLQARARAHAVGEGLQHVGSRIQHLPARHRQRHTLIILALVARERVRIPELWRVMLRCFARACACAPA